MGVTIGAVPPQTPLSRIAGAAQKAAPASSVSALKRAVIGGRRGENVTLPVLGAARIELLGAKATNEAAALAIKRFESRGLVLNGITARRHDLEFAVVTLSLAVFDPADTSKPFGTLEEWEALDEPLVSACWHVYGDVEERLNPMEYPLSVADVVGIEMALKKKDGPLLRSYGVKKLCDFMLTTADLPSTSPKPSSSSGEFSKESSISPEATTKPTLEADAAADPEMSR